MLTQGDWGSRSADSIELAAESNVAWFKSPSQVHRRGDSAPLGHLAPVCRSLAFAGDFTPLLAKHSKSFSLVDCISIGVDRMQRNFEPTRKRLRHGREVSLSDVTAKVVIYEA